jgi:hypothetical protein
LPDLLGLIFKKRFFNIHQFAENLKNKNAKGMGGMKKIELLPVKGI